MTAGRTNHTKFAAAPKPTWSDVRLGETLADRVVIQGEGKGAQYKDRNIRWLQPTTTMNAEQALKSALVDDLTDVLVIGYLPDGGLVIRSSRMSRAEALWLTERARRWTLGDAE